MKIPLIESNGGYGWVLLVWGDDITFLVCYFFVLVVSCQYPWGIVFVRLPVLYAAFRSFAWLLWVDFCFGCGVLVLPALVLSTLSYRFAFFDFVLVSCSRDTSPSATGYFVISGDELVGAGVWPWWDVFLLWEGSSIFLSGCPVLSVPPLCASELRTVWYLFFSGWSLWRCYLCSAHVLLALAWATQGHYAPRGIVLGPFFLKHKWT